MSWREAFLRQARADDDVRALLNEQDVPYSHQLHYLQMVTEKLAKAYLADPDDDEPPEATHSAFVRLLQTLKRNPEIRRALGFEGNHRRFVAYLNSLMPLAERIEALAPAKAKFAHPNPEYPWRDGTSERVVAPVDHSFDEFDPRGVKMIQLTTLVAALLRFGN